MAASPTSASRPSSVPLTVVRNTIPSFKSQVVSSSPWMANSNGDLSPSLVVSTPTGTVVGSQHLLSLTSPTAVRAAAQEAFYRSDSTRTGWLTLFEFRNAMRQLGFQLSDSSTVHFFRDIDAEGRGKINVEQFASWYGLNWKVLSTTVNPAREEVVIPVTSSRTVDWLDRLAVTEAENRRLHEENKSLQHNLHEARLRVADYDGQAKRVFELTSDLQNARITISDLNKQVGGLSAEAIDASRLRNHISGAEDSMNNMRSELRETQSHLAALKRRLGDVEGECQIAREAAHKADMDRLNANAEREFVLGEKRALEVRVGAVEAEAVERLQQVEQGLRTQRELAAHLSALEKERDELGDEVVQTRAALRRSDQKLGSALLAEQMLSDKVVSLEQALKQAREEHGALIQRLDSSAKALQLSDHKVAALTHTVAQLETKLDAAARADQDRLKELQHLTHALAGAHTKIVTLEANVAQGVADLKGCQGRVEERNRLISELQEQVSNHELTIETLRAELTAHQNIIPNLERTLEQLRAVEAANVRLRSDYEETKAALDAIYALPDPCGVGIKIESEGAGAKVSALLEDMSALRSGAVAVGDVIRAIDGTDVQGCSIARIRELIVGQRGSYVAITLSRKGSEERFDVQLRRGSYGPEFQVVGAETKDGVQSRGSVRARDVPVQRLSSRMVTF